MKPPPAPRPAESRAQRSSPAASLAMLTALALGCSSSPPPPSGPARPPAASPAPEAERARLPVETRREDVVDVLHGVPVPDPYRWLEDGESPEVVAWTAAQNAHTDRVLGAFSGREALARRFETLLRTGSVGAPAVVRAGGRKAYFFRRQAPSEDQSVLYVRDERGERKLVDPNAKSADGTVSLDYWFPSWDGKLLAYGLSTGGDEESTLRVLDVATGKDLPATEVITRARYASVAWLPDGSGFYYSRYPEKGSVPAGEERYHRKVFLHQLGRSPDEDPVVFGEGRRDMTDMPAVEISPKGRWLVATVHMGWSRREAYLLDRRKKNASWVPLAVPEKDAVYEVTPFDDHLLVRTNDGAPTYKAYRVDPEKPERGAWKEIVPAREGVLESLAEIGGELFAAYIEDARSVLRRFGPRGEPRGEVALPTLGRVDAISGAHDGDEAFFSFTSFTIPVQVFRVDLRSGARDVWAEVEAPVDPEAFSIEQRRATSKDGTKVPFFLVRRKDAGPGPAPTVLYGYGGFNISLLPEWSGSRYALLERGGTYVVANLRGGGEYGEAWHRAGMLGDKPRVFEDFVAVAEELVKTGVTSPEKLAIAGGSNGGLLVGAAITQRPDLFRAAVSLVPLLDMVRYHRFQLAKLWIPEYGSSDDPEQFKWLFGYSPYHRVEPGKRYPAVLITSAEGDSRVDPLHARKMAAMLQYAATQAPGPAHPVLLRIETKAGHGAGKPISKRVDEQTDIYAFLFSQLGVRVDPEPRSPASPAPAAGR